MDKSEPEDLIDRAIEVAARALRKQVRKGTKTVYITHPFAVGIILAGAGCSGEIIAAGILHDVVKERFLSKALHGVGKGSKRGFQRALEREDRAWEKKLKKGYSISRRKGR